MYYKYLYYIYMTYVFKDMHILDQNMYFQSSMVVLATIVCLLLRPLRSCRALCSVCFFFFGWDCSLIIV